MRVHLVWFTFFLVACEGPVAVIKGAPPPAPSAPDINISLDPANVLLPPGETAQFDVAMQGTVAGPWKLSVTGLPAGVTGTFEPQTIAPGQTAVLALSADPSAPDATSTITVTVSLGESTLSAQGTITVQSDSGGSGGGSGIVSPVGGGNGAGGGTGGGTGSTGGGSAAGGGTSTGGAGGGTSACPGYADPSTPAGCTCASGHSCAANHCYGGWYCNVATLKCVAPPSSCASTGGGSGGGGGSTGTGGGSTGTGGGSTGTGGGSTGTGVGPSGGTVSLLHFGVTGDTRPPNCEDTANYPTAVINGIADAFQSKSSQFVVDLGDHMYVCNNSLSIAQTQMGLYMSAVARYSGTWFMTMGNHECTSGPCLLGSTNANYSAFMSALAPVASKPYYSFDVQTSLGRATFVIVADNAWDSTQQSWLTQVLTDADANAKYTLVFRHHPEGDTSVSTNTAIMTLIRQHKFAMFLSGHTHSYKHMTTDQGRDLVIGLGGAPLIASGATYNGYAMIDQQSSGDLQVTVYDLSGSVKDTWSVPPN